MTGWYEAASQLEAWAVICTMLLREVKSHPASFKMVTLIEDKASVGPCLWSQDCHNPAFPATILRLLQMEFNNSFCQALERRQRVRWPNFQQLRRSLTTGNFRPEIVAIMGALTPT